ncbi:MAG: hypothetical protein WBA68_05365 [Alteraurantiacibacter sp.]
MARVQIRELAASLALRRMLGGFSIFALSACSPAVAQERPPIAPTLTALEFFGLTPKTSSISSYCGGHDFDATWTFDGERTAVTQLLIGGEPSDAIATVLEQGIDDLDGEAFIQLDCSRDGIGLRLIEARYASMPAGRRILYNIIDREIREIARYGFD